MLNMDSIEDFINAFDEKNNLFFIQYKLSHQVLDYYINNYQNIKWNSISINQELPESIIELYQDKLNWYYIFIYQTLSEDFISKYIYKVNLYAVSLRTKKIDRIIDKFKYKFEIDKLESELNNIQ